jgi:hypothetical protein
MADPADLVLGVVSLGALFSTCIEYFGYFTTSRDFEKDRNNLLIK